MPKSRFLGENDIDKGQALGYMQRDEQNQSSRSMPGNRRVFIERTVLCTVSCVYQFGLGTHHTSGPSRDPRSGRREGAHCPWSRAGLGWWRSWGRGLGGHFSNTYFISSYVYMSVCGYMHVCAGAWKSEASDPLESELWAVESHLT